MEMEKPSWSNVQSSSMEKSIADFGNTFAFPTEKENYDEYDSDDDYADDLTVLNSNEQVMGFQSDTSSTTTTSTTSNVFEIPESSEELVGTEDDFDEQYLDILNISIDYFSLIP